MHLTNSNTIIHISRDSSNGLYYMDLNPQSSSPASGTGSITHTANSAYSVTTKRDLVQYLHRVDFSPVVSTWTKAIDTGYFSTWTGLTSKLVRNYLPLSLSTTKGHIRQDRQNIRYTKPVLPTLIPETSSLSEHDPTNKSQVRSNCIFIKAITVTGKISTDQPAVFLSLQVGAVNI